MNSVISITEGDDNTFQMKTTERVWAFQAPNEEVRFSSPPPQEIKHLFQI